MHIYNMRQSTVFVIMSDMFQLQIYSLFNITFNYIIIMKLFSHGNF